MRSAVPLCSDSTHAYPPGMDFCLSLKTIFMKHNHHEEAANHHEEAAKHHREAHKQHTEGNDEKAAHHAQTAKGHSVTADEHSKEAAKKHTTKHGTTGKSSK